MKPVDRHISVREIREAFSNSQVIEDYPDDKYGPSCLILGFTLADRPLHILCNHPSHPLAKNVTLYEPDPDLWIDFRTSWEGRRPQRVIETPVFESATQPSSPS